VSSARRAFVEKRNGLLAGCKLAASIKERDPRQLALQGGVVQIHAAFEEYVEDFLSGWIFKRASSGAHVRDLPARLRAWLLHIRHEGSYRSFFLQGDEKRVLDAFDKSREPMIGFVDDSYVGRLDATDIICSEGYPSMRNLRKIFYRLGLDDLKSFMSSRIGGNAEQLVDAFSTTRTTIAHSTAGPITYRDVLAFAKRGSKIVQLLDYAFFESLVQSPNSPIWPA